MMPPQLVKASVRLRMANRLCERTRLALKRAKSYTDRTSAGFDAVQAQSFRRLAAEHVRKLLYGEKQ